VPMRSMQMESLLSPRSDVPKRPRPDQWNVDGQWAIKTWVNDDEGPVDMAGVFGPDGNSRFTIDWPGAVFFCQCWAVKHGHGRLKVVPL